MLQLVQRGVVGARARGRLLVGPPVVTGAAVRGHPSVVVAQSEEAEAEQSKIHLFYQQCSP